MQIDYRQLKRHIYDVNAFYNGKLLFHDVASTILFEDDAKYRVYRLYAFRVPSEPVPFDDIVFEFTRLDDFVFDIYSLKSLQGK